MDKNESVETSDYLNDIARGNLFVERMSLNDLEKIKDILTTDFDDFWNENILRSELENQNSRYFVLKQLENNQKGVAGNDTCILGFGGFIITPDDIEITNIVIKKSCRNFGLGNYLFEKILVEAENFFEGNNSSRTISLEVNETNKPAIALYKRNGFVEVGARKRYYEGKFDAIIMSKNLT